MISDHSGTLVEAATGGVAGRSAAGVGLAVGERLGVGDAELGVGVGVTDGVVGGAGADVLVRVGSIEAGGSVDSAGREVDGAAVAESSGAVGSVESAVGSSPVMAAAGAPGTGAGARPRAVAPRPPTTTDDAAPARTRAIHRNLVRMDSSNSLQLTWPQLTWPQLHLAATALGRKMGVGLFQYEWKRPTGWRE
jgi:hypothetical protein